MLKLKSVVISAPFGNWLRFNGCTSTGGTFTAQYRGNFLHRAWRCIRTLRYDGRGEGSWVNKLGLPNPGAASVADADLRGKIVSVHGFDSQDWFDLVGGLMYNPTVEAIELNLSCPNVNHAPKLGELKAMFDRIAWLSKDRGGGWRDWLVIAKLPPVRWEDYVAPLVEAGVTTFHCCNTLPCPEGGRSGSPLKPYSLAVIREIRRKEACGDYLTSSGGRNSRTRLTLIGGGGIARPEHAREYLAAGADHVAVASTLLNPFNWWRVRHLVHAVESWQRTAKEFEGLKITRRGILHEAEEARGGMGPECGGTGVLPEAETGEAKGRTLPELREAPAEGGLSYLLALLTGEGVEAERPPRREERTGPLRRVRRAPGCGGGQVPLPGVPSES